MNMTEKLKNHIQESVKSYEEATGLEVISLSYDKETVEIEIENA